jgi:ubiquinol-cytochrome c reductase iron-sulfur subunit
VSRSVVLLAVVGLATIASGVVVAVAGGPERAAAAFVGIGVVVIGATCIAWVHATVGGEEAVEERDHKGPDLGRRRLILGAGIGTATLTAGALAVPAARRVERATDRLRSTAWADGVPVVDADGQPVVIDEVAEGDMMTVYPEGHVGSPDSQAVLVREPEVRFDEEFVRDGWVVSGVVVLSKLCTHMGCPLGLYQQQTGTLLCPCHQATFDVLDGGRPLQGPASRRLPRLPIGLDEGGRLIARGDFDDAVGTGFWWRP